MDDNFSSIVKAVKWGRNVHGSVRKFLQFQLTVNITAVVVAFISATIDSTNGSVLTPIQLLWVNLIMDTFAALALGTEPPSDALLDHKPYSKRTPLISFAMWKMIVGMSLFQILVAFILLYAWPVFFHLDVNNNIEHQQTIRTLVFNTFVFLQVFNEINCRRIDKKFNVFKGLRQHHYFLIIFAITVVAQVLIVEFGGVAFQTVKLPYYYWFLSIGIGASTLLIGVLIRLLPDLSIFKEEDQKPHEIITYEKWRWESAIGQVQTQLRVVNALRRRPY